ncbi:hypothetical protein GALMADRAFT_1366212 [Galerina marginata CBS 339.88]|uniref:Uncharacterized protein n=1 Tax=Galerina marginata (strain CBS 339.88) TaxID=685588 RepID=A0A067SC62_GALM3|nr:hypothetical protein GALMADRAFT_1366212 [Galerina marginata CBS 339.88]
MIPLSPRMKCLLATCQCIKFVVPTPNGNYCETPDRHNSDCVCGHPWWQHELSQAYRSYYTTVRRAGAPARSCGGFFPISDPAAENTLCACGLPGFGHDTFSETTGTSQVTDNVHAPAIPHGGVQSNSFNIPPPVVPSRPISAFQGIPQPAQGANASRNQSMIRMRDQAARDQAARGRASGGFSASRRTPNNIPVSSLAVIQVMVWPHAALTLLAEHFFEDETEGLEERSLHVTMQALAQVYVRLQNHNLVFAVEYDQTITNPNVLVASFDNQIRAALGEHSYYLPPDPSPGDISTPLSYFHAPFVILKPKARRNLTHGFFTPANVKALTLSNPGPGATQDSPNVLVIDLALYMGPYLVQETPIFMGVYPFMLHCGYYSIVGFQLIRTDLPAFRTGALKIKARLPRMSLTTQYQSLESVMAGRHDVAIAAPSARPLTVAGATPAAAGDRRSVAEVPRAAPTVPSLPRAEVPPEVPPPAVRNSGVRTTRAPASAAQSAPPRTQAFITPGLALVTIPVTPQSPAARGLVRPRSDSLDTVSQPSPPRTRARTAQLQARTEVRVAQGGVIEITDTEEEKDDEDDDELPRYILLENDNNRDRAEYWRKRVEGRIVDRNIQSFQRHAADALMPPQDDLPDFTMAGQHVDQLGRGLVELLNFEALKEAGLSKKFRNDSGLEAWPEEVNHLSFLQEFSCSTTAGQGIGNGPRRGTLDRALNMLTAPSYDDHLTWQPSSTLDGYYVPVVTPHPHPIRLARFTAEGRLLALGCCLLGNVPNISPWVPIALWTSAFKRASFSPPPMGLIRHIDSEAAEYMDLWNAILPKDPIPANLPIKFQAIIGIAVEVQPTLISSPRSVSFHKTLTDMIFSTMLLGHPEAWNSPEFRALCKGFNIGKHALQKLFDVIGSRNDHSFPEHALLAAIFTNRTGIDIRKALLANIKICTDFKKIDDPTHMVRKVFQTRLEGYLSGVGHPASLPSNILTEEMRQGGKDDPGLRSRLFLKAVTDTESPPRNEEIFVYLNDHSQEMDDSITISVCVMSISIRMGPMLRAILSSPADGAEHPQFSSWLHGQLLAASGYNKT